jgi:hypothetical protein
MGWVGVSVRLQLLLTPQSSVGSTPAAELAHGAKVALLRANAHALRGGACVTSAAARVRNAVPAPSGLARFGVV